MTNPIIGFFKRGGASSKIQPLLPFSIAQFLARVDTLKLKITHFSLSAAGFSETQNCWEKIFVFSKSNTVLL